MSETAKCYTSAMKPKASKALHIKLSMQIWDRLEKFRFRRMFATRTEAIEFLLDYALKANPQREQSSREHATRKGED
jgi:hypothetical protein